jgi:virginiamycin B lyase
MRRCALAMTVLLLASAHTTAAQTITEFPIPTAASSIVAGPDGALWYNQRGGKKIGRITTAGTVTEFLIPLPPRAWVYTGIVAGPDGALWFGIAKSPGEFPGPTSRSIWRITTTREFSEFLLPPSPSVVFPNPNSITTGPDGALWLTGAGTNNINRITTAGAVSEFLLPTPNSRPLGITAGPDGALWFAESAGNKIGRITPAGEFNEFPLPTSIRGPWGITAGPDGAVWFTGVGVLGGKIGRIGQSDEDVKAGLQTFHWERWILSLEILTSLAIIIARRLKRLHLHWAWISVRAPTVCWGAP